MTRSIRNQLGCHTVDDLQHERRCRRRVPRHQRQSDEAGAASASILPIAAPCPPVEDECRLSPRRASAGRQHSERVAATPHMQPRDRLLSRDSPSRLMMRRRRVRPGSLGTVKERGRPNPARRRRAESFRHHVRRRDPIHEERAVSTRIVESRDQARWLRTMAGWSPSSSDGVSVRPRAAAVPRIWKKLPATSEPSNL